MASDQQTRVLLSRFAEPDFMFCGATRKSLHELCRKTGLNPKLAGYFVEMDAHPLPIIVDWGNGIREQAYLVECLCASPLYIRAVTVSFGKPTTFILARTLRAAILDPWGVEGLISSPAVLVLDNEPICKQKSLKDFVDFCGGRIAFARDYCPHAKPRVESCGAILKSLAIYPVNSLGGTEGSEPGNWVSIAASQFMPAVEEAIDFKNRPCSRRWVQEMKRFALGASRELSDSIASVRWPVTVKVEGDLAVLDSGETFQSDAINDLLPGRYKASRSLDPLDDYIEVFFEGVPVATAARTQVCPASLKEHLHYLELPRL